MTNADFKAAGDFLRIIRQSKHESQSDVGRRAKPTWNSSSISDIEGGKKKTAANYLPRIAQAYQLTSSEQKQLRILLGMPITGKPPKGITTFRTSTASKMKLEEVAHREGRTVSNVVNRAVREFLERYPM